MTPINPTQALRMLAESDRDFAQEHATALRSAHSEGSPTIWHLWTSTLLMRVDQNPSYDLVPHLDLMEHFAVHGDQAVLDAVCIQCVEVLVHHVSHDESTFILLLKTMGSRCRSYAIAWFTSRLP